MSNPVVLGTPKTATTTKALLLGSGELGREVAIALQRFGVEVHAADSYEGAPAHHVASFAHVINMTDPAAVRELVTTVQPDYVIPEIEAIATAELELLEAEGIATVIPTARATRLTMNREGIRTLAAEELGLPTSAYAFADTFAEFSEAAARIGFPCVVKPVMSSSGKGQSVVKSAAELQQAWDYSQTGGRVKQQMVIIEEFLQFDYEITLLTVRSNNTEGETVTSYCAPIGHRQAEGDYVESWQPMPMSEVALRRAQEIAHKITTALGGRGLFGVELFVQGDTVYFSEVSPRPHDTGMVTMATQRLNEFELHARAILGLPVDCELASPGASAVIYGIDAAGPVSFTGLEQALALPQVDVRLFGKPVSYARRRLGVAIAAAADVDQARELAQQAAQAVRVVDPAA